MSAKFVNIDRDTPMLLPPDLREWLPEDHLVHFLLEVVDTMDTGEFRVNHRGTGSRQYPPSMMLSLLVCCSYNLKRLFSLLGSRSLQLVAPAGRKTA
jgi:transposase